MKKKLYLEPVTRILFLAFQENMLSSASGTGSDLVSTGDYDGDDFDDLFD